MVNITSIILSGNIYEYTNFATTGDIHIYTRQTGGNMQTGIEGYYKASIFDGRKGRHFDLSSLGFEDTYASTRSDAKVIKDAIIMAIKRNAGKIVIYNPITKKFSI